MEIIDQENVFYSCETRGFEDWEETGIPNPIHLAWEGRLWLSGDDGFASEF